MEAKAQRTKQPLAIRQISRHCDFFRVNRRFNLFRVEPSMLALVCAGSSASLSPKRRKNEFRNQLPAQGGPFKVEGQQARQRLFFRDVHWPAVSRGDRGVEFAMRIIEPSRPLVVKIGQRPRF